MSALPESRQSSGRICLWEVDCLKKTGNADLARSMRCRTGDDESVICRPCLDAMDRAADEAAEARYL